MNNKTYKIAYDQNFTTSLYTILTQIERGEKKPNEAFSQKMLQTAAFCSNKLKQYLQLA